MPFIAPLLVPVLGATGAFVASTAIQIGLSVGCHTPSLVLRVAK